MSPWLQRLPLKIWRKWWCFPSSRWDLFARYTNIILFCLFQGIIHGEERLAWRWLPFKGESVGGSATCFCEKMATLVGSVTTQGTPEMGQHYAHAIGLPQGSTPGSTKRILKCMERSWQLPPRWGSFCESPLVRFLSAENNIPLISPCLLPMIQHCCKFSHTNSLNQNFELPPYPGAKHPCDILVFPTYHAYGICIIAVYTVGNVTCDVTYIIRIYNWCLWMVNLIDVRCTMPGPGQHLLHIICGLARTSISTMWPVRWGTGSSFWHL